MGFSREEFWSGLPFPSPGDLPNQGMEPRSPALQADSLSSEPPRNPKQRTFQQICRFMRNEEEAEMQAPSLICLNSTAYCPPSTPQSWVCLRWMRHHTQPLLDSLGTKSGISRRLVATAALGKTKVELFLPLNCGSHIKFGSVNSFRYY